MCGYDLAILTLQWIQLTPKTLLLGLQDQKLTVNFPLFVWRAFHLDSLKQSSGELFLIWMDRSELRL